MHAATATPVSFLPRPSESAATDEPHAPSLCFDASDGLWVAWGDVCLRVQLTLDGIDAERGAIARAEVSHRFACDVARCVVLVPVGGGSRRRRGATRGYSEVAKVRGRP